MTAQRVLKKRIPKGLLEECRGRRRYVVFGDLQVHPWQESRRADPCGDALSVIDAVYDVAEKVFADEVVFLGDLFEAKRAVRSDYAGRILACFNKYAPEFTTQIVVGNHDLYNSHSILASLEEHCTVHYKPTLDLRAMGHALFFVAFAPYESSALMPREDFVLKNVNTSCIPAQLEKFKIAVCFSHCQIAGAPMGESVVGGVLIDRGATTLPAAVRDGVTPIFNGHYHRPREMKLPEGNKVVLVGAPMQYNWTDIDSGDRGIVVVDVIADGDSVKVEHHRVWLEGTPRFFSEQYRHMAGPEDFVLTSVETAKQEMLSASDAEDLPLNALHGSDARAAFSEWVDLHASPLALEDFPSLDKYVDAVAARSDLAALRSPAIQQYADQVAERESGKTKRGRLKL